MRAARRGFRPRTNHMCLQESDYTRVAEVALKDPHHAGFPGQHSIEGGHPPTFAFFECSNSSCGTVPKAQNHTGCSLCYFSSGLFSGDLTATWAGAGINRPLIL